MKSTHDLLVEDYNVPLSPWYILNSECFSSGIEKIIGQKILLDSLFIFEKDQAFWGPNAKQFNKLGEAMAQKLETDPNFLEKITANHLKYFKDFKKLVKLLLTENLRKKDNISLFKIYSQSYQVVADCWSWSMPIQFLEMGNVKFSDKVYSDVIKKFKHYKNPDEIYSKFITPLNKTYLTLEHENILKAIKKIQSNKKNLTFFKNTTSVNQLPRPLLKIFNDLATNYGWLQYYYVGPAATNSYYYELIKRKINTDVKKEFMAKIKEERNINQLQKTASKLLNNQEKYFTDALRNFMFLKEYRKELMYYTNYAMSFWYKEIGRRFYISPLQARYILKDEYERILYGKQKMFSTIKLNDRYNLCAYELYQKKISFSVGKAAITAKQRFKKTKADLYKNIKKLNGTVAYPGIIKGTVRIVNKTKDMENFKDGDILFSFSTNPSLVPAMNRAAAIVTDTGGVTCHAAIVSRELKLPCIVGTKIGTKIFKNGDKVEVDATKGIVKKIK